MAEAMLRARLADVAPEVTVGSAGLLFEGREAERSAVHAMAKRGLDLHPFRARKISAALLAGSSLVLGMERAHVREVVVLDQGLLHRAFTLIEFVSSATLVGPRPADEPFADWVDRIGRLRTHGDYLVDDPTVAVPDPMGQSGRVFRSTAEMIDAQLVELVDLAWPTAPAEPLPAVPVMRIPVPDDLVDDPTLGGPHADRDRF